MVIPPDSSKKRRCKAKRRDGTPCGVRGSLINGRTGLCPAHEHGKAWSLENARRGGEATRRRWRTDVKLPALDSHENAQRWKEIAGIAVARGEISAKEALAIISAAREWQRSDDEMRRLNERLRAIEDKFADDR
jgi:hypothetical protein